MWDALRRLMAPPIFAGDEEKTRVAAVFNTLLLSFLLVLLAYACVAVPLFVVRKGASLLICAVFVGIWAGARTLLHVGHVRVASLIWLAATWALATTMVILGGGVRTPSAALYLSVPVLASLLLPPGGTLTALGVCGLTAAGLAGLEAMGRLPHPYFPAPPGTASAMLIVSMVWTIIPLNLALRSLRQAVATAREQVAERTRAEGDLGHTQSTLAQILDSVPQSIFWKDLDGAYLGCNRVFARAAGLDDPRQIVGKTDFDLPWPREEAETYRADDREVVAAKRPKRHIIEPLQQANGTRLWIDTTKVPLLDERGDPRGVLGVYEDATERKRAEEALRASEERFRRLFDGAADAFFLHDQDGRLVDVNRAACDSLGYTREELLAMSVPDVEVRIQPADLTPQWERIRGGHRVTVEGAHRRRDGTTFPVEIQIIPFEYAGRPLMFAAARDITERKQAEAALRDRQETINAIVEASSDWIWAIDAQGRHTYSNPAAARILGYPVEDILRMGLDLLHEEDRARVHQALPDWIASRRGWTNILLRWRHREGGYRHLESNAVPVLGPAGELLGFRGVDRDASDRIRAEEVLQAHRDRLEAVQAISVEIAREMQLPVLLERIIQHAIRLMGGVNGSVFLWDEGRQLLVPEVWIGREPVTRRTGMGLGVGLIGTAAARRTGLIVNDYRNSPFAHPEVMARTTVTAAIVEPLLYQERLVGVIHVDNGGTDLTFSAEHGELLRLFATQAAIAIENARLFQEERQRREQLEAVRMVSAEIARELDLDRLLDRILRRAMELAGTEAGVIMLWDEAEQALLPRLRIGEFWAKMPVRPIALGEGAVGHVAQTRQGIIINDYRAWVGARQLALTHTAITACLGEPLLYRDTLVGVINLIHTAGKGTFAPQHGALLRLFGDQAAIAIENARLFQEERQRRQQLEAVRMVSAEIARELDLTRLLDLIMRRAMDLVGGTGGAILIWDEANQRLTVQAHIGEFAALALSPIRPGEGMVGRVVATRKGLVINDYQAWEGARPEVRPLALRAGIAEPLVFRGTLIGVVNIATVSEQKRYSEHDSTLLRLLADQAAVAIENARLYKAAQRELAERKQAEAVLAAAHARLRAVLDAVPDQIYVKDAESRFLVVNESMARVLGVTRPEEILGKTDHEFFPPELAARYAADERQILSTGKPLVDLEEPAIDVTTGAPLWHLTTKVPVRDPEGAVVGTVGVSRNITERKQAEEETRRLRNYLANIVNSMPSILVGVDPEGRVTQWNAAATQATGLSSAQAQGQPLAAIFPALRAQLAKVAAAMQARQVQTETKVPRAGVGETRYEDITIFPLATNGIEEAVIRVDDVTERVRLEEMMIQSEKMISVGGLAAGMAHEINNPLGVILQAAQNVLRRVSPDLSANKRAAAACGTSVATVRKYLEAREVLSFLEDIHQSGRRAAEIVANMLSFSRKPEGGGSSTDLADLLDRTLALAASDYDLNKQHDFRRIAIVREYAPDVPLVLCQGPKVQQVLLNLLRNAAEAIRETAAVRPPQLTLRVQREEEAWVRVEIVDNGPGMDEATRRRIFEPFFTTKAPGMGTGLGLSVSYFIVTEDHGGTLAVDSTLGEGTTFVLRLPVDGKQP